MVGGRWTKTDESCARRPREERLRANSRKEGLACDVVQAHSLKLARNVGVNAILAHALVMLDVILLETSKEGGSVMSHQ